MFSIFGPIQLFNAPSLDLYHLKIVYTKPPILNASPIWRRAVCHSNHAISIFMIVVVCHVKVSTKLEYLQLFYSGPGQKLFPDPSSIPVSQLKLYFLMTK